MPKNYFKSKTNREAYLQLLKQDEEARQQAKTTPTPETLEDFFNFQATTTKSERPADFSAPPPIPNVICKINRRDSSGSSSSSSMPPPPDSGVSSLLASPLPPAVFAHLNGYAIPSARAIASLSAVRSIHDSRVAYDVALRNVAAERGKLQRLREEQAVAQERLLKLKNKIRSERLAAQRQVAELTVGVQDQERLVDEAEGALMTRAQEVVATLSEAGKGLSANIELPVFIVDPEAAKPNINSFEEVSAAREWLRQISRWCLDAESKIKMSVGRQFICSVRYIGLIPELPENSPCLTWDVLADPVGFVLHEDNAKGLAMLEEANIFDVIITLSSECDLVLFGYERGTSTFFPSDVVVSGTSVFEASATLVEANGELARCNAPFVTTCLSAKVRQMLLRDVAEQTREELLQLKSGPTRSTESARVQLRQNA